MAKSPDVLSGVEGMEFNLSLVLLGYLTGAPEMWEELFSSPLACSLTSFVIACTIYI